MSGHFSNLLSSMKRRMGSREHAASTERSPQQATKHPATSVAQAPSSAVAVAGNNNSPAYPFNNVNGNSQNHPPGQATSTHSHPPPANAASDAHHDYSTSAYKIHGDSGSGAHQYNGGGISSNNNSPVLTKNVVDQKQQQKHPPPGFHRATQSAAKFSQLPMLKDVTGMEAWRLFKTKVALCGAVVYNFGDCQPPVMTPLDGGEGGGDVAGSSINADPAYAKGIEDKRTTLQDLLLFMNDNRTSAQNLDAVADDIVQMVGANIFRPLPPPSSGAAALQQGIIEDEWDATLDPVYLSGWLHLQPIYEIFLTLIICPTLNPKVTKRLVDQTFILKLLDLFSSEDGREREYLKTISHRLYGKIMNLRSFIRRCIENIFMTYIDANEVKDGVSELLEILGSIINGFAQPLKDEHIKFLKSAMIPLHKVNNLIQFHQQLSYCMIQYIEKDVTLITPILSGILRYWPMNNTPKEILFINEVEDLLELVVSHHLQVSEKLILRLFKKIHSCIISQHFHISERTLFLWNNPKVVKLVNQHKQLLYPTLIEALYVNTQYHWNFTVHSLSFNVSKLLAEADPRLYAQCSERIASQQDDQFTSDGPTDTMKPQGVERITFSAQRV